MTALDRIKTVIIDRMGYDLDKVLKPEMSFEQDLSMDSLDRVDLAMGIEEEFNISMPDSEIAKLITVQDVINYVETKV